MCVCTFFYMSSCQCVCKAKCAQLTGYRKCLELPSCSPSLNCRPGSSSSGDLWLWAAPSSSHGPLRLICHSGSAEVPWTALCRRNPACTQSCAKPTLPGELRLPATPSWLCGLSLPVLGSFSVRCTHSWHYVHQAPCTALVGHRLLHGSPHDAHTSKTSPVRCSQEFPSLPFPPRYLPVTDSGSDHRSGIASGRRVSFDQARLVNFASGAARVSSGRLGLLPRL